MKNKLSGCGRGEAAVGRRAEVWGRIFHHGLTFHLLDADARSQEKKSEWYVLNGLVNDMFLFLLSGSGLFMGKVTNHCTVQLTGFIYG